jgi:hypothetical protein
MSLPEKNRPLLKIYGERNTGTNYLSQLAELNLDAELLPGSVPGWIARLPKFIPGKEMLRDAWFRYLFSRNLGWKHSKVLSAAELSRQPLAPEVRFVTLTKNPYSWLLSLYKRPYSVWSARAPDFESFVISPWRTFARDNSTAVLPNPVQLWNEKNASYVGLEQHFSAVRLRYEDLVLNPAETIDQIAKRLKIRKKSDQFINLEESTKQDASTFSDYQQYYLREQWRTKLSTTAIARINSLLDENVVQLYGYSLLTPAALDLATSDAMTGSGNRP